MRQFCVKITAIFVLRHHRPKGSINAFASRVRSTGGQHQDQGDKVGAYQSLEERLVFEPYTKEARTQTFDWIAPDGIFAETGMGRVATRRGRAVLAHRIAPRAR